MDQGLIAEDGSPAELLHNSEGLFSKLIDNTGSASADELRSRAAGAADVQLMDTNNDGVLDAAEFAAGGGSKQEFDKYDLNGEQTLRQCVNQSGERLQLVHGPIIAQANPLVESRVPKI